jgi:hypothetical protein
MFFLERVTRDLSVYILDQEKTKSFKNYRTRPSGSACENQPLCLTRQLAEKRITAEPGRSLKPTKETRYWKKKTTIEKARKNKSIYTVAGVISNSYKWLDL